MRKYRLTEPCVFENGRWKYLLYHGGASVTEYTGNRDDLDVPAALGKLPVTGVARGKMSDLPHCRVTLPATVMYIGEGAFSNCSRLRIAVIPPEVTYIGEGAFSNCPELLLCVREGSAAHQYATDHDIPVSFQPPIRPFAEEENRVIGDFLCRVGRFAMLYIREYIGSEEIVIVPPVLDGMMVAGLDPYAFANCDTVHHVSLPDGMISMGESAFSNCPNLITVSLPDSLQGLSVKAFHGCRNLRAVRLPEGLKEIPELAFSMCRSLRGIDLPASIEKIGEYAFTFSGLEEIYMPPNLRLIERRAFIWCEKLRQVWLNEGLIEIRESAFKLCTHLKEPRIPHSVSFMGADVMFGVGAEIGEDGDA